MPEKDQTLVRRTQAGERNAFGDLVEKYSPLVHGLILESIRQPDAVEDLVQEVFCKAYEKLSHLRQPARFSAWLASIAANEAQDFLRRQQVRYRTERSGALSLNDHRRLQDELFESNEMASALWEALDRLPPEYRRAVVLYYLENCSLRDIARFLDVSLTTVKWRLNRAQKRLKQDLLIAHYREAGRQSRNRRKVRDKIMAGLPIGPFFRQEPSGLFRWGRRLMLGLGATGLLGILGILDYQIPVQEEITEKEVGGYRVRRTEVELPKISISWEPRRPQRGTRIRIEASGVELEEGIQRPELHYLTHPQYPLDQVAPMVREGDVWTAEIEMPGDTPVVCFYVSPGEEGPLDLSHIAYLTDRKRLQRYQHSIPIVDAEGHPVQDVEYNLGLMAEHQGRSSEEILVHLNREVSRYPENFQAHLRRWVHMSRKGNHSERIKARVKAEQEALIERYPDRPEALWWTAQIATDRKEELYRQLYQRFPENEHADEAAYLIARERRIQDDADVQMAAQEEFIHLYPESRYLDEVYIDRLRYLARAAPEKAVALADSLIEGSLIPPYDPEKEQEQRINITVLGGRLPEGYAYSLRFDLLSKEGEKGDALDLAERLISSDPRDPYPYLYIGRKLSGETGKSLLYGDSLNYPRDLSLAIEVLEAGLKWAIPKNILELPGYGAFHSFPDHVQSSYRQFYLDQAYVLRQRFLQSLAECRIARKEFTEAVPVLAEAAELEKKIERYHWNENRISPLLGEAFEHLEKWEEAESAYLQAVRQNYSDPAAESALKRIHRKQYGDLGNLQPLLQKCYPAAPEFELTDIDGRKVRSADFQGKVLTLYYNSSGNIERRSGSFPSYVEDLKRWEEIFPKDDFAILHVSRSPKIKHSLFRLALDNDGLGDKLRIKTNSLFLIDRIGRLRLRRELWRSETGQTREVGQKIRELLAEDIPEGHSTTAWSH